MGLVAVSAGHNAVLAPIMRVELAIGRGGGQIVDGVDAVMAAALQAELGCRQLAGTAFEHLRAGIEVVAAGNPAHALGHLLVDLGLVAAQAVHIRVGTVIGRQHGGASAIDRASLEVGNVLAHGRMAHGPAEAGAVVPGEHAAAGHDNHRHRNGSDDAPARRALLRRRLGSLLGRLLSVLTHLLHLPTFAPMHGRSRSRRSHNGPATARRYPTGNQRRHRSCRRSCR